MKEEAQQMEWSKAREVVFSVDLVEAAKQQLQFLAVVNSIGSLYNGPALDRAIYRYKYCWLPLLAKHVDSPITTEPLVVPLDCEWIWHCYRLNPMQYKMDCEEIFGKNLDNLNVLSTTKAACTKQAESIWNDMYPTEPYYVQLNCHSSMSNVGTNVGAQRSTNYDLAAAVKRQRSFFHKVSKYIIQDDCFFEEAVLKYKAFLHLIKRKKESPIKFFCVPTEDIDLIWHSHQLYPLSYSNDLKAILGKIVDHNDRDSSSGAKLRIGFAQTTKLWEETFGGSYLRARVMHTYIDQVAKCGKLCVEGFTVYRSEEYGVVMEKSQTECCDGCVDG
ncbi:glycine-rich domain-containing protein 2-like [Punica granatum]|uniref:Glycine-rich domain-containing protein 2-like n=2 Tax=Punica granatum TaxID=22663 RepID=A0A6P8CS68_PUNGR|nr:glycine-rich domain-containing protein 2-like [Punica granatum]PKI40394.1 hypothetical protein CRG98_039240 [Punica granatum]